MHLWPSMRLRDSFKDNYLKKLEWNLQRMNIEKSSSSSEISLVTISRSFWRLINVIRKIQGVKKGIALPCEVVKIVSECGRYYLVLMMKKAAENNEEQQSWNLDLYRVYVLHPTSYADVQAPDSRSQRDEPIRLTEPSRVLRSPLREPRLRVHHQQANQPQALHPVVDPSTVNTSQRHRLRGARLHRRVQLVRPAHRRTRGEARLRGLRHRPHGPRLLRGSRRASAGPRCRRGRVRLVFNGFRAKYAADLPAFLYAESLGGAIALMITLRREGIVPERRFDGVVLNGAMCGISDKFKPPWPLEHFLSIAAFLIPTWCVVPTRGSLPNVSFKVEWKRKLALASPRRPLLRPRAATAQELLRVCRDLQSKFSQVDVPFLIVHGGDDASFATQLARRTSTTAPLARTRRSGFIPECGTSWWASRTKTSNLCSEKLLTGSWLEPSVAARLQLSMAEMRWLRAGRYLSNNNWVCG
ncbi:hypothetical protein DH2020_010632 [Rehmannia glutinosa]|uniref:Serine aminopeptidase S33 domain-containing protein n=1 Tax=Rehmannia glutinosa TaxID=99300 RepID=A0ABR0XB47_REHGL